jgi:signal transduction histidine kinase
MGAETGLISAERKQTFTAVLVYRLAAVVVVAATAGLRETLPLWMRDWIIYAAIPLFFYNLAAFLWRDKLEQILTQYPRLLVLDMFVSFALLEIGGGWRNSYFVYTLSTLLLFTVFLKRPGVWSAAAVFFVFALIRDPTYGLSGIAVFGYTDWDMRAGAALFYVSAGLIFGYFDTLPNRIERLAQDKIDETERAAKREEGERIALELHDHAKSMITALLIRSRSLLRDEQWDETYLRRELEWLWRGMSYLQTELTQLVKALRGQLPTESCDLAAVVHEGIGIVEDMTGCHWVPATKINEETTLSLRQRDTLRSFLFEALMNTWKHSGVSAGTIELTRSSDQIVVVIADQGRGFDLEAANRGATLGLKSLHHRAQELGGQMEIMTSPGQGCRLTLTFHL